MKQRAVAGLPAVRSLDETIPRFARRARDAVPRTRSSRPIPVDGGTGPPRSPRSTTRASAFPIPARVSKRVLAISALVLVDPFRGGVPGGPPRGAGDRGRARPRLGVDCGLPERHRRTGLRSHAGADAEARARRCRFHQRLRSQRHPAQSRGSAAGSTRRARGAGDCREAGGGRRPVGRPDARWQPLRRHGESHAGRHRQRDRNAPAAPPQTRNRFSMLRSDWRARCARRSATRRPKRRSALPRRRSRQLRSTSSAHMRRARRPCRGANSTRRCRISRSRWRSIANFGLGWAGMGIASSNMDKQQDAEKYIKEAVRHLDGMTERERYRTRGLFYYLTSDYPSCVKEYSDLIARYAADAPARNNLALCLTHLRQLPKAVNEMREVVRIVPKRALYRTESCAVCRLQQRLQERGRRGPQHGRPGTLQPARARLCAARPGAAGRGRKNLRHDRKARRARGIVRGIRPGRSRPVRRTAVRRGADFCGRRGSPISHRRTPIGLPANWRRSPTLSSCASRRPQRSPPPTRRWPTETRSRFVSWRRACSSRLAPLPKQQTLAKSLASELQAEPQAYAKIIEGETALKKRDARQAIKELSNANALLETWMGHFDLGRAYLAAGAFTQADSEFDRCLTATRRDSVAVPRRGADLRLPASGALLSGARTRRPPDRRICRVVPRLPGHSGSSRKKIRYCPKFAPGRSIDCRLKIEDCRFGLTIDDWRFSAIANRQSVNVKSPIVNLNLQSATFNANLQSSICSLQSFELHRARHPRIGRVWPIVEIQQNGVAALAGDRRRRARGRRVPVELVARRRRDQTEAAAPVAPFGGLKSVSLVPFDDATQTPVEGSGL